MLKKKFDNILNGINYFGLADNRIIESIFYDSRKVKKNSLFIAIDGFNNDGHQYIDEAIKLGAHAIITNKDIKTKYSIPIIKVESKESNVSNCFKFFW